MRLRTKLVFTATGLTFAIVLLLSVVFLGELLRQRIQQTYASNDVLAHQMLLATRHAVETGLRAHPPPATLSPETYDDALHAAVVDALRSSDDLTTAMDGIVKYSPPVQDVSVTDAYGFTIVSTDVDEVNQRAPYRDSFDRVRDGGIFYQMREVFGKPKVLDIAVPLDRNRMPFLIVHIGVRSSLLRAAYEPWLRAALEFVLLAMLASMAGAALLSTLALRPLRTIGEQLESLTFKPGDAPADAHIDPPLMLDSLSGRADPIGRVSRTIDRLGRQMRSQEEGYTALQTNLNQMLDTLRDGVLLFAPDRRAVMVSDAVANFIERSSPDIETPQVEDMVGMQLEQIFVPGTRLGDAILAAFERGAQISAETVTLEDGRQVQISLDRIGETRIGDSRKADSGKNGQGDHTDPGMGTLLTLRDTGSALELEQELEVSRRLAAIGRLTANVGHEVKNPINAMVVHLELLRGKLAGANFDRDSAQRHVEILADEMHRLDRVVETLADFSRPMDLDLREHDLRRVIDQTLELAGAELKENGVRIESESPPSAVPVRVDAELIRQAFLNLLLNAMQAMPTGGVARVTVRRDQRFAIVEFVDNGVGIPASVLPRIFDLYFTTKPRGSGIGLAMTYRILQLHGGAMEVRSNADPASPEHGTTFTLHIPISLAPGNESRRQFARLASAPDPVEPGGSDSDAPADTQDSIATTMEKKEIV
jgi:signal transduction histidine kinase